jgi:hypothetical protein
MDNPPCDCIAMFLESKPYPKNNYKKEQLNETKMKDT